jgi:hypothetical protein
MPTLEKDVSAGCEACAVASRCFARACHDVLVSVASGDVRVQKEGTTQVELHQLVHHVVVHVDPLLSFGSPLLTLYAAASRCCRARKIPRRLRDKERHAGAKPRRELPRCAGARRKLTLRGGGIRCYRKGRVATCADWPAGLQDVNTGGCGAPCGRYLYPGEGSQCGNYRGALELLRPFLLPKELSPRQERRREGGKWVLPRARIQGRRAALGPTAGRHAFTAARPGVAGAVHGSPGTEGLCWSQQDLKEAGHIMEELGLHRHEQYGAMLLELGGLDLDQARFKEALAVYKKANDVVQYMEGTDYASPKRHGRLPQAAARSCRLLQGDC